MGFSIRVPDIVSRVRVDTTDLSDGATKRAHRGGLSIGKAMGGAIAVGFAAVKVAQGLGAAIDAASDYSENVNKNSVVFGPQAGDIKAWADQADAIGLSQNAALGAAGTYGNLFRALGLNEKKSADYSKSLTELAADMASFGNTDIETAIEALRSGMTGETEPLKQFGVNMNEATIQASALSEGLVQADVDMAKVKDQQLKIAEAQAKANAVAKDVKATDLDRARAAQNVANAEAALQKTLAGKVPALTAAQKAQASYALIMDQTKLAQGDFDRSADTSLANQKRILDATKENLKVKIGGFFLPGALRFTQFLSDSVIPAVGEFVDQVGPAVARIREMGLEFGERVAPYLQRFGGYLRSDILPLLLRLGAYVTGTVIPAIREMAVTYLQGYVLPIAKRLGVTIREDLIPAVVETAHTFTTKVVPTLMAVWKVISTKVLPIITGLAEIFVEKVLPAVIPIVKEIAGNLITGISGLVKGIVTGLTPALTRLVDWFEKNRGTIEKVVVVVVKIVGKIAQFASVIVREVLPVVGRLAGFLAGVVIDAIRLAITAIAKVIGWAIKFGKAVWDVGSAVVRFAKRAKDKFDEVRAGFGRAVERIVGAGGRIIGWFKSLPGKIWDGLKFLYGTGENSAMAWGLSIIRRLLAGIREKFGDLKTWFLDLPGKIKDSLADLFTDASQWGIDLIQGFIDGIVEKATELPGIIKDKVVGGIGDTVTGLLDINSPSRVAMGWGGFTSEGMALGITAKAGLVADAARRLATNAKSMMFTGPDVAAVSAGGGSASGAYTYAPSSHTTQHVSAVYTGTPKDVDRQLRDLAKRTNRIK